MKAALAVVLCACGARTELAGTIASDSGANDVASACHDEIIAMDPTGAGWLALDGDEVFWGTSDGLVRVHDSSGNTTLVAENEAITGLAVDPQYVYYAITGRIRRVPRHGGAASDLFTNAGSPSYIALAGSDVFWMDYDAIGGSVRKNGMPIVSMLGTPAGLAVDGDHLFVACALAFVNQQSVLGPLLRANLDGSEPTALATNLHEPSSVKTFQGRVYYIEQVDSTSTLHGGVRSIDEAGGTPKIEVTTDDYLPIDFSVDSSGVYVTATTQPTHSKLVRGTVPLAQDADLFYEAVQTNVTAVYWTIGWTNKTPPGGATVRKLCK